MRGRKMRGKEESKTRAESEKTRKKRGEGKKKTRVRGGSEGKAR